MTIETKTEDQKKTDPQQSDDPIAKLRDEFQTQFTQLKTTFETENKKNLETISQLQKENEDLHRALIRSAQMPKEEPPPQKTEEEIYADKIIALSERSKQIERLNRGIFDDKH